MFGIANNTEFLTAIGIANAPEETKSKLIAGIEDLAQKRLVTRLSEVLTDEQAAEFGNLTDEQQAQDWLTTNVPNFQDIVADVLAGIKTEILENKTKTVG